MKNLNYRKNIVVKDAIKFAVFVCAVLFALRLLEESTSMGERIMYYFIAMSCVAVALGLVFGVMAKPQKIIRRTIERGSIKEIDIIEQLEARGILLNSRVNDVLVFHLVSVSPNYQRLLLELTPDMVTAIGPVNVVTTVEKLLKN